MRIAICDDNPVYLGYLHGLVEQLLTTAGLPFEISRYESSEALWAHLRANSHAFDVLLLDILMEGMTGVQLAEELRGLSCDAAIVFITSCKDYALEAFNVRALHYLIKPVDEKILAQLLFEIYQTRNRVPYVLIRQQGGVIVRCDVDDIEYIEKVARKTFVREANRDVESIDTLATLQRTLPAGFIRCHQGYLLNVQNIAEIRHGEAFTKSGRCVPVSRANAQAVKNAFVGTLYRKGGEGGLPG